MELPIKTISIVLILALLLVIVGTFLFQSAGGSLSKTDAERIFSSQCQAYVQQGCEWDATYGPEFPRYLSACRTLYGEERDSYSCLYTLCKGCFETTDIKCAGLCNICNGHTDASVDQKTCCSRFTAQCGNSPVDCGSCSADTGVCLQAIWRGRNTQTGEVRTFPNSCIPSGWESLGPA